MAMESENYYPVMNDNTSQTRIIEWKESSTQMPIKKFQESKTQTQRKYFQKHFSVQVDIKVWKPQKYPTYKVFQPPSVRGCVTPTLKIDNKVVIEKSRIIHAKTIK